MIRPGAWRRLVKADPGLTARDKLVGLCLVEHPWRNGGYSRREHDLAAELGMHTSSIVRGLRALTDAGYLAVTVRGRKGVQQVYALTLPDDSASHGCVPESATQLGNPDKLKAVSARHRAVAESATQLGNPDYPSFSRDTDATPRTANSATASQQHNAIAAEPSSSMRRSVPTQKVTGGTYNEQQPTRVRISTQEDDDDFSLYAVGGPT